VYVADPDAKKVNFFQKFFALKPLFQEFKKIVGKNLIEIFKF
jgi:hypothetical protein